MRDITKIVLHHSISPRDLPLAKSLISFNKTHNKRLVQKYGMPLSKIEYSGNVYDSIAYHFVISGNGDYCNTRQLKDIGYHASDYKVNNESIGICLTGDFRKEKPTKEQYETLNILINRFKYCTIHKHSEFSPKDCPGKNLNFNKLKIINKNYMKTAEQQQLIKSVEFAMKNLYNYGDKEMKKIASEFAPKLRAINK